MKLVEVTNKALKEVETTGKVVEKAQKQLETVQAELHEKQQNKQKIIQAMNVIEASLVIDPNDKHSITQKKRAEKKISDLTREIEKLTDKQQKALDTLTNARKEHNHSKGEAFKNEYIKEQTGSRFWYKLEKLNTRLERSIFSFSRKGWEDWFKAYGFPLEEITTPVSTLNKAKDENMPFIKSKSIEADEIAEQKAEELIAKVEKAIEDILTEEGILSRK